MRTTNCILLGFPLLLIPLVTSGCANPVNQVTSDRYMNMCIEAERQERLSDAEQACYRSLVNVDMGFLGPELKSQRLYELGRIKRKLGKFEEAEPLFLQSLEIEEKLSGPASRPITRTLTELAVSYIQGVRINKGLPFIARLETMTDILSESEKKVVGATFYFYSKELKNRNQLDRASKLATKSYSLGFVPPTE